MTLFSSFGVTLLFFSSLFLSSSFCTTVELGILLPLSSNYYPSAQQWKSAIEWLASESGEDSYNISLSLHIKDTQNNNLISAITGVIELVEEGVHVVIGEINSEIVEATQQVLNANQVHN